jgi:hypothetical protein
MSAKFLSRGPAVVRPTSFRPTLEALDDRVVLSAVGGLGSATAIMAHPAEIVVTKPTEIVVTKDNDSAASLVRLRRIVTEVTTLHDEAVHPMVATMTSFQWGIGRGAAETVHVADRPVEHVTLNF